MASTPSPPKNDSHLRVPRSSHNRTPKSRSRSISKSQVKLASAHPQSTTILAPKQDFQFFTTIAKTPSYRITPFALANRPFNFRGLRPGDSDLKMDGLLKIRPIKATAAKISTPLKGGIPTAATESGRKTNVGIENEIKNENAGCDLQKRSTPKRGVKRERDADSVFESPNSSCTSTFSSLRVPGGMSMAMGMSKKDWELTSNGDSLGTSGLQRGTPARKKLKSTRYSPSESPSPSPMRSLTGLSVRTARPALQLSPTPKPKRWMQNAAHPSAGKISAPQVSLVQGSGNSEAIRNRVLARLQGAKKASSNGGEVGTDVSLNTSDGFGSLAGEPVNLVLLSHDGVNTSSVLAPLSPYSEFSILGEGTPTLAQDVVGTEVSVPEDTIVVHGREICMCKLCARTRLV